MDLRFFIFCNFIVREENIYVLFGRRWLYISDLVVDFFVVKILEIFVIEFGW